MIFLDKTKVLFYQAVDITYNYIYDKYKQASQQFTISSPYMQIITVLYNISENIYLYFEDSINELNILKARKIQSIHGLSRLVGHDPARANCAKGELKLKIKFDEVQNIVGSYIVFTNGMTALCKNNNLIYTAILTQDKLLINSNNKNYIYFNIYQGEFDTQTFISNGTELQSFNVQQKKNTFIDEQNIAVYVNGERYPIFDFLYDLDGGATGCLVKTGINGGIDIYFGNGYFGKIPEQGAQIQVTYLQTYGVSGNIYSNVNEISFEWQTIILDNLGNEVDINDIFSTELNTKIIFGSNPEDSNFTKLIAPNASRTNVLGNPDSYIYFLQKLNIFSYVDAYTLLDDDYLHDNNIIYLFLVPDVKRKLEEQNYFQIPSTDFVLENDEKDTLLNLIVSGKKQVPGAELQIVDPTIKRYIANITIRVYEGYDDTTLRSAIVSKASEYFLAIKRRDRIPRSDLIRIIERVDYVDSVHVEFISAMNEKAIAQGFYVQQITDTSGKTTEQQVTLGSQDDPNLGLDEFGDIIMDINDLPILRGNFYDRNNNYYTEYLETGKQGPFNITIKEVIKKDLYTDIIKAKLDTF